MINESLRGTPKHEAVLWITVLVVAVACGAWAGLGAATEPFVLGLATGWVQTLREWHSAVGPTFPFLISLPPLFLFWGLAKPDYDAISVANELSVSLGTLGTVIGMVGALRSLDGVEGLDGLLALVPSFCNALISTGVGLIGLMVGVVLRKLAGISKPTPAAVLKRT